MILRSCFIINRIMNSASGYKRKLTERKVVDIIGQLVLSIKSHVVNI